MTGSGYEADRRAEQSGLDCAAQQSFLYLPYIVLAGIGCSAAVTAGLVRGALTANADMAPTMAMAKAASHPMAGLKPAVKLSGVPMCP